MLSSPAAFASVPALDTSAFTNFSFFTSFIVSKSSETRAV